MEDNLYLDNVEWSPEVARFRLETHGGSPEVSWVSRLHQAPQRRGKVRERVHNGGGGASSLGCLVGGVGVDREME